MRRTPLLLFAALFLWAGSHSPLPAQGSKAKRDARTAESETPKNGVTFQVERPFEKTYQATLDYLKRAGYAIDSEDKGVGQIMTTIDISGDRTQTGKRLQISITKNSDTQTAVRVAVTTQKRKKASRPAPWSDPEVDNDESTKAADALKAAISAA